MLTIRRAQIQVFREAMLACVLADLEAHVRRHFPAVADKAETSLLRLLHAVVDRALDLGLETPEHLCRYVNLAAALGWDFDTAAEHAWLVELLRDASIPSVSHRLRLVGEEVERRLRLEESKLASEETFRASVFGHEGTA